MFRRIVSVIFILFAITLLFFSKTFAEFSDQRSLVTVLKIEGAIGPAVQDYIQRGIAQSDHMDAKAIVLIMDTPGGLATSMREIIKNILSSPIPVISFVYPSGARAASAGTYILYASHVAAMAPGTNLGAATPVNIIIKDDEKSAKNTDTSQVKAINDAKTYIRSLAQLRGRNEQWAVKAVTQAESLSAHDALKQKVIDVIANSIPDLLKWANGKIVLVNNIPMKISIVNPKLMNIEPDWRSKILHIITDPSLAYILLMLGVYGLFFEFMNPGYVLPGVVGAISLLIALYAFQLLPINYTGLFLILLGIVFFIAEIFMPSFGALGFGGIISFIIGSFLLLDTNVPGFTLPWQLIIGITATTALFLMGFMQLFLRSRYRKVVSGIETLIGKTGEIEKNQTSEWVIVSGERWRARSSHPLHDKQTVSIVSVDGLTLVVEPLNMEKKS